ncbi:MAG TPA: hypothetical protein VFR15_13170 [Chloroflexia bacterium]|nr:hypothetical protein [Chloroflexia bacterium]
MSTVADAAPRRAPRAQAQEPEWLVWLTLGVALLLGYLLLVMITGQSRTASAGSMSLSYPSTWVPVQTEGAAFSASDRLNGGAFAPTVTLYEMPRTDLLRMAGGVEEAAANWTLRKQDELVGYRVLSVTGVGGGPISTPSLEGGGPAEQAVDTLRVDSVYLVDPVIGATGIPALMRGIDVIRLRGETFYILSYSVENSKYDSYRGQFESLLNSWRTP